MEKQLYKVKEVAEIMNISVTTVYRMIEKKEIPIEKIGRITRIPYSYLKDKCQM